MPWKPLVSKKVMEQYEQLRLTGKVNMREHNKVIDQCAQCELYELMDLLLWQPRVYFSMQKSYDEHIKYYNL